MENKIICDRCKSKNVKVEGSSNTKKCSCMDCKWKWIDTFLDDFDDFGCDDGFVCDGWEDGDDVF